MMVNGIWIKSGMVKLELYHLDGRLILSKDFEVFEGFNKLTLVNGLEKIRGIFQIQAYATDGEVFVRKFIKLE